MPSYPGIIANPNLAFGLPDPAASTTLQGTTTKGVYVPEGWGANWLKALQAAKYRNVIVTNWSASIWNGFYSSNWQRIYQNVLGTNTPKPPTGIEGLVMDALQQKYGDGGSGYFSVQSVNGVVAGSASTASASGAGGNFVGGWDTLANVGAINNVNMFPHVSGSGVTVTDTNVRGSNIDVYWYPTLTAGPPTLAVTIDGVAQTAITLTVGSVTGIGKTTYPVSPGTHTLQIAATVGQPFLVGWCGRFDTGILPVRLGKVGRASYDASVGNQTLMPNAETTGKQSLQGAALQSGGTNLWGSGKSGETSGPDLLIVADMMLNDITYQQPVDVAVNAFQQILNYARIGNPNCEILVVNANLGAANDFPVRTVTDANGTSGTNLLTSVSAAFGPLDLGSSVIGTNIPTATIIQSVCPSAINQVSLSKNLTGNIVNGSVTINRTGSTGVVSPSGNGSSGTQYPLLLTYIRALCEQYGAAWVNFWPFSNTNYGNWSALGYFGDGTNDGLAGNDPGHLSDKGFAYEFSVVAPLILMQQ